MRKTWLICLLVTTLQGVALAQHQEVSEPPKPYKALEEPVEDTTITFRKAFLSGQVNGHFRTFFMATDNTGDLADHNALALGGGLRYETASFKGFRFAVGGAYLFRIASTDLLAPDPASGTPSRYEIGLFDVDQKPLGREWARLEELYLEYKRDALALTVGRQFINMPFVNLQDGRMRPGAVDGLVGRWKGVRTQLEGGYLYAVSPRSTTQWYSIEKSIGLYPSGVNPDGTKSDYHGHVSSAGLFYAGAQHALTERLTLQGWDMFADGLMNSLLLQADLKIKTTGARKLTLSGQFIRQDGVGDGGNADQAQTYFPEGGSSMAFGVRFACQRAHGGFNLNYTRITGDGRYLMPREWGRDPMFTFMPRERNEGLGDVHAVTANWLFKDLLKTGSAALGVGYYDLPDVKDYALNKYGMPSYVQANLDLRYKVTGWLEGLDIQYLLVVKWGLGETYGEDRYVANKVDMALHNLVVNYHF
jgi:hypothetical protein